MSQYERDLADYSRRQRNPLLQGLAGCGIRPESGTFPDYVLAEAAQLFSPDRWRQPNIGTIFRELTWRTAGKRSITFDSTFTKSQSVLS